MPTGRLYACLRAADQGVVLQLALWIEGSLFFAAIAAIQERLDAMTTPQTHVVIVAPGINFIDLAGAEFLALEATKRRESGGGLYLVRLKERPYKLLERGGYWTTIKLENLFGSKNTALQTIFPRLDQATCAHCPHQVFRECASVDKHSPSQ